MEVTENVAKKQRGNVDRISELPDFILHDILSRLDTKEAGRASVLSKSLYGAWLSIPVLNFQPGYFKSEIEDDTRTLECFVEFIDKTMQRYFTQKYRITKMHLTLPKVDEKLESLVDKWIMVAVQNQIQRMEIKVLGENKYTLPEILFGAKSLKYLICSKVGLPYYANMKLISLEYLTLVPVTIDERMLQEMISFCPLVELDITYANYSKSELLLPLIKNVNREVQGQSSGMVQTNLQASQLQKFVYCSFREEFPWPWNMNVSALKNLRKLKIFCAPVTDDIVSELACGLVALESLELDTCLMLKRIKISSISLKELQMENGLNYNLESVTIDAPNLREFSYNGRVDTPLSLIRVLDHCNAHFFPVVTASTNEWFIKLKKFLTETKLFKSLMLNLASTHLIKAEMQLRNVDIGPPYKLRELMLHETSAWDDTKSSLVAFLDGLFWCCHPGVLSIKTTMQNSAVQLIVSILKEKAQCWKDPLKSVEVECIGSPHFLSSYQLEIRLRLSW